MEENIKKTIFEILEGNKILSNTNRILDILLNKYLNKEELPILFKEIIYKYLNKDNYILNDFLLYLGLIDDKGLYDDRITEMLLEVEEFDTD